MSSKAPQYRAIERAERFAQAVMILWCGVRLAIRVFRRSEIIASAYIIHPCDPSKHDGAVAQ